MGTSPFDGSTASPETTEKNEEVRRTLRAHGDNGKLERRVTHYLYPKGKSAAQHEGIARELEKRGFTVSPSRSRNGIIAEDYREVASVAFDCLTEALESWLEEQDWEYDGWECEVRRTLQ